MLASSLHEAHSTNKELDRHNAHIASRCENIMPFS